ncbi:hypothetical protein CPB84DRAFT_1646045, partial [Gymnopilus junonius]
TVTNILMYHSLYGTSTNPFGHHPGCLRLLDEEDCKYLDSLLQCKSTIYLDEVQLKLSEKQE